MRRRDFLTVAGGAALAWPLAARAQEPGRTYRLGGLTAGPSPRNSATLVAMFDELRRLGFIEGQNLIIDWREYALRPDLLPEFAADLVKARVDVIYASGDIAIRAAQRATTTIPILGATEDMVAAGFAASLARPGYTSPGSACCRLNLTASGRKS